MDGDYEPTEAELSIFQACIRERMRLMVKLDAIIIKLKTLRDREYPPSKAQTADERERELRHKISAIRVAHHQAAMEEIEPLMKVLSNLENCKPRPPILLDDGRLMQYVGPLPTWGPGDHFDFPTAT